MKFISRIFLAAAFAVALSTAAETKTPPAVPEITIKLRAQFWRAYAEQSATAASAARAQENMKTVETELRAACGDSTLAMDEKGEPTCKAKDAPAKK